MEEVGSDPPNICVVFGGLWAIGCPFFINLVFTICFHFLYFLSFSSSFPRVFIFDSMLTSPRSLLHNYASPRLQYFNHIRCFARTVQTDPTTMSIVYHRHPPRPTLPPSDICIIVATSLLWSDYCSLFLSACTVYIAIKTE